MANLECISPDKQCHADALSDSASIQKRGRRRVIEVSGGNLS